MNGGSSITKRIEFLVFLRHSKLVFPEKKNNINFT